ncbi:MAG: DnaJ domain-containing protein, partial [Desulfovermiculus sp.]
MLEKDCAVLRVSRDADMETVRKAFVKLSRRYPPEHFPEKFKEIKKAYDRLSLNPSSISSLVKDLASIP